MTRTNTSNNRILRRAAAFAVAGSAAFGLSSSPGGVLTSPSPHPSRVAGFSTSPGDRQPLNMALLSGRKAGGGQQEY